MITNAEKRVIAAFTAVGISLGQLLYSWTGRIGTGIALIAVVVYVLSHPDAEQS